jgi:DNA-binding GntR family transcriptional regulator
MNALVDSCMEHPTSFDQVLAAERADVEFHDVILTVAGNALVQKTIQETRFKTQRLAFSVPPGRYRQSHSEHRAIIHALGKGDGDAAETQKHIQSARLAGLDIVNR